MDDFINKSSDPFLVFLILFPLLDNFQQVLFVFVKELENTQKIIWVQW